MTPRARARSQRPTGRRILVVCEGKRDERHYIDSLRTTFRLSAANLIIESADGGSPDSIVAFAIAQKTRFGTGGAEALDEAWVLLDSEKAEHSGIQSAVDAAIEEGLQVAVSNPCFELWLLLHAQDRGANMTAKSAKRLLESELNIPGPAKAPASFNDERLTGDWQAAAARAEARRDRIIRDESLGGGEDAYRVVLLGNPATCVDRLIHALVPRSG
jgi:hypothetical protein